MRKKTVLIVDDHLLFSRSLKILVDSFPEYSVEETLSNGKELMSYFNSHKPKPDVLLLDIRMPVMNGLETMDWLKEKWPAQKVLALSMEDDETTVISMLRKGANGYLLKDVDPEEFLRAMELLLKEGFYHSDLVKKTLRNDKNGKIPKLSERELLFLRLSCTELTYREIADKMGRSHKTIDGYRENLFSKLEVKSRTGLVMYAIRHKLVTF